MVPGSKRGVHSCQSAGHDDMAAAADQSCQLGQQTVHGIQHALGTKHGRDIFRSDQNDSDAEFLCEFFGFFRVLLQRQQPGIIPQRRNQFLPFSGFPAICITQRGERGNEVACGFCIAGGWVGVFSRSGDYMPPD